MRSAFGVTLLVAGVVACAAKSGDSGGGDGGAAAKGGKGGKGSKAGLIFAVDMLPVESKTVDYVITAPGTIDAFEHVQVTARVAGPVDRVAFTEGQLVKAGQVLAVIDTERYQLAVNGAQAALEKMQASQSDSEAMVTRRQVATDAHPGLITGEELASYKTKAVTAQADTRVAGEALKTAALNLRDSSVRAPIEGIVQTRTVETGQYVATGYVMATILRSDPMLLRFNVQPSEAPRIATGMTVGFTMRETQRSYLAKISLVGGAADSVTHMIPVTAALTEADHKFWLRPGSFCDVSVNVSSAAHVAPVIPRLAARATDHGYVAYTIDGDTAHERLLSLGLNTTDGWVEIRSGLIAGEMLVVRGGEALVEGAKVHATTTTAQAFMATFDGGAPAGTHDIDGGDVSAPIDAGAPVTHHGKGGAAPVAP